MYNNLRTNFLAYSSENAASNQDLQDESSHKVSKLVEDIVAGNLAVSDAAFTKEAEYVTQKSLTDQVVETFSLISPPLSEELSPSVAAILSDEQVCLLMQEPSHERVLEFLEEMNRLLGNELLTTEDTQLLEKVLFQLQASSFEITQSSDFEQSYDLIAYHNFRNSEAYQDLLNYERSALSGPQLMEREETVGQVVGKLSKFAEKLGPYISLAELMAIYQNVKTMKEVTLGLQGYSPVVKMLQDIAQVKEAIFEDFLEKFQVLDRDAPFFHQQIEKLEKQMQELPSTEAIVKCLQELRKPSLLMPTANEIKLLNLLQSCNSEDQYHAIADITKESAQKDLLRFLQAKCDSKDSFQLAAKRSINDLKNKVLRERAKKYLTGSPNLAQRFPSILDTFEKHMTQAIAMHKEHWEVIKTTRNLETHNRFSAIADKIAMTNMAHSGSEEAWAEHAGQLFFEIVDGEKIEAPPAEFKQALQAIDRSPVLLQTELEGYYAAQYLPMHQWIVDNLETIESVYDQAMDDDRNLGIGTCSQNCRNRLGQLMKKPALSGREIFQGSTVQDRMNRSRYYLHKLFSEDPAIVQEETERENARYGIKLQTVTEKNNTEPRAVLDSLIKIASQDPLQSHFLVSFQGHVINVQIDCERNIYRFLDDNGFYTSFSDLVSLQEGFTNYLVAFYREPTDYIIYTFQSD